MIFTFLKTAHFFRVLIPVNNFSPILNILETTTHQNHQDVFDLILIFNWFFFQTVKSYWRELHAFTFVHCIQISPWQSIKDNVSNGHSTLTTDLRWVQCSQSHVEKFVITGYISRWGGLKAEIWPKMLKSA